MSFDFRMSVEPLLALPSRFELPLWLDVDASQMQLSPCRYFHGYSLIFPALKRLQLLLAFLSARKAAYMKNWNGTAWGFNHQCMHLLPRTELMRLSKNNFSNWDSSCTFYIRGTCHTVTDCVKSAAIVSFLWRCNNSYSTVWAITSFVTYVDSR